jgi:hypothetical protein
MRKFQAKDTELYKEIDRLMDELGKKTYLAQANVLRIVEKFRTQAMAEIQVTTANALNEWTEQVAKLQVLRVKRATRKLWGPGFWKPDKANSEVIKQNLIMDFMRIALRHREEVNKLLGWYEAFNKICKL